MTPEGIKKEKDVDRSTSITNVTSQKLNSLIIGLLVLALGYFAFDKFVLDPGRDAADIEAAVQTAQEEVPLEAETAVNNKSIAVLPFVNMSSDEEQEYFSDGLSEELLNLLAKIPELQVAARTSSFSFKGQNIEIPEIAERLGVANVLEGSVRKSGNQIRITAQLIQADNGFHLWSETFDRNLDNIFQIQDEIAQAVVDSLKVTLLGGAPKSRQTDPEAYQLYLEGQYFASQRTTASMAKGIDLFNHAVQIDPGYTPAWAELAYTYQWYAGTGGMPINEGNALADQAIEMALSTDPNYGYAYFVRGVSLIINKFQFKEGEEDYRRARELDPGNAVISSSASFVALVFGRNSEALSLAIDSQKLDPVMPELHDNIAQAHWHLGDLEQAENNYRKVLSLSPDYIGAHHRLARVLMQKGELIASLEHANKEISAIYRLTSEAMVQFTMGNREDSDESLAELIRIGSEQAAYQIAQVYGIRNEPDKVFEWLEQAYLIRDSGLASLLGDPSFKSVLNDPRWPDFLDRLDLLEAWHEMSPEWGGPQL
jgi:TolB-like protein/Flp pilus assembly protein TadD